MSINSSWFTASVSDQTANISIFDEIGLYGVNARDFEKEFKSLGTLDNVNLHINSPGGEVFDGLAIHNILRRSKALVNVYVDGLAASIASVIAMAGDNIVMPENSMMMIHDPTGVVVGTSREMRDLADAMDKIKSSMISAYGSQTNLSRQEIADLMSKETWLTAQEAVDLGFATQIEKPIQVKASFNLSKYKNGYRFFENSLPKQDKEATAILPDTRSKKQMTDTNLQASATQEENTAVADKNNQLVEKIETISTKEEKKLEVSEKETTIDLVAKAKEEERKRLSDIYALCQLSNMTDKALEFISSNKSLADIINDINSIKSSKNLEINTKNVAPLVGQQSTLSWDKSLAHVNARK